MTKKIRLFFLIPTIIILLAGCSDNASDAILDYVPDDTAQPAEEQVVDEKQVQEKVEREGEWSRNIPHYTGGLTIDNVTPDSFDFELGVAAGGNTGSIGGKAQVTNDTALFKMADSTCEIVFSLKEEVINLETTEECQSWGGNGTFFHGDFEKGTMHVEADLVKQGILTKKENRLFEQVVGKDYSLFVDNMMKVFEEEDLDGLQTKALSGHVQGVATSMNAIIKINDEFVYAAVPNDVPSSFSYYTNDPDYKEKLPVTIQKWAGHHNYEDTVYK